MLQKIIALLFIIGVGYNAFAGDTGSQISFSVTNSLELYKASNGSNVIQNGKSVFVFSAVDGRPYCYVTSPNNLPTAGLATVTFLQTTSNNKVTFETKIIPHVEPPLDMLQTIYCKNSTSFGMSDMAKTLSGVILISPVQTSCFE